jgi:hypothetical protein
MSPLPPHPAHRREPGALNYCSDLGRSGNGSFSHEHYSSSPSKTLRAALGFSFHSTGCVKRENVGTKATPSTARRPQQRPKKNEAA